MTQAIQATLIAIKDLLIFESLHFSIIHLEIEYKKN